MPPSILLHFFLPFTASYTSSAPLFSLYYLFLPFSTSSFLLNLFHFSLHYLLLSFSFPTQAWCTHHTVQPVLGGLFSTDSLSLSTSSLLVIQCHQCHLCASQFFFMLHLISPSLPWLFLLSFFFTYFFLSCLNPSDCIVLLTSFSVDFPTFYLSFLAFLFTLLSSPFLPSSPFFLLSFHSFLFILPSFLLNPLTFLITPLSFLSPSFSHSSLSSFLSYSFLPLSEPLQLHAGETMDSRVEGAMAAVYEEVKSTAKYVTTLLTFISPFFSLLIFPSPLPWSPLLYSFVKFASLLTFLLFSYLIFFSSFPLSFFLFLPLFSSFLTHISTPISFNLELVEISTFFPNPQYS